jgi:hypothetical protein
MENAPKTSTDKRKPEPKPGNRFTDEVLPEGLPINYQDGDEVKIAQAHMHYSKGFPLPPLGVLINNHRAKRDAKDSDPGV